MAKREIKKNILYEGKIIGYVQNGTLVKTVRSSRHFLRKPPAIAFNVSTIERAIDADAENILIFDTENNLYFTSTMKKLEHDGFEFNRGHGEQIALALDKWERHCPVCYQRDWAIKGVDCGC